MSIGAYAEGKKYEPERPSFVSAMTVGTGYLAGGLLVCLPYFLFSGVGEALKYCLAVSLPVLFAAGYLESTLYGTRPWLGSLRVLLTGAAAAGAAFFVGRLFE